ncbi:hypothetical protein BCV72DRAFT_329639, partial [Rhizopus microsporus var. microsporus]
HIQQKRFKLKLCTSEQRFIVAQNDQQPKTKPVMFIGDEGTGAGSRIKGFLRYGGIWKQRIQVKYVNVRITDEYMASQVCLYCFSKLDQLMQRKLNKGRQISFKSKGSL